MNRTVPVLLVVFLVVFGLSLFAQQAAKSKDEHKPAKKIFKPTVYLGQTNYSSGPIRKQLFDSLLKKGLTSHDSLGNRYKVIGFDFTYAERRLYEDSIGNLEVLTDYTYAFCPGDTVPADIDSTFFERTKPGDTAFMDHIKVVRYVNKTNQAMPDSTAFMGKGMKLWLVR